MDCSIKCDLKLAGKPVEDPMDCTQYYFCLKDGLPTDSPIACENGTYFISSKATVDKPCQGIGNSSDCTATCHSLPCETECEKAPGSNVFVNDKSGECYKYVICAGSQSIPATCPPDFPYFSLEYQKCTNNSLDCCDTCTPFCYTPNSEIVDPKDCTKFYFCEKRGPITDLESSLDCPPDTIFSSKLGHCTNSNDTGICEESCKPNSNRYYLY